MNERMGQSDEEGAVGPLAGERLAEARRLKKISLPDIARELHLDEPKVQALEENRFDILGAPVFAKGHLRKYAEIVGISVDTVMTDYQALTNADIAPPVVGEPRKRTQDLNLGPWLFAIPVILVIIAAVYWWLGRSPAPQPSREVPAALVQPQPVEREPVAVESLPDPVVQVEPSAPAGAAGETLPLLAEPVPVTDNAAPTVSGNVELRLAYSGDCWTEVTDAAGERLFFDLGRSGRTVRVSGTAPLRVLLGDSNNVSLTVNGQAYSIDTAEFRGDTARLTIN